MDQLFRKVDDQQGVPGVDTDQTDKPDQWRCRQVERIRSHHIHNIVPEDHADKGEEAGEYDTACQTEVVVIDNHQEEDQYQCADKGTTQIDKGIDGNFQLAVPDDVECLAGLLIGQFQIEHTWGFHIVFVRKSFHDHFSCIQQGIDLTFVVCFRNNVNDVVKIFSRNGRDFLHVFDFDKLAHRDHQSHRVHQLEIIEFFLDGLYRVLGQKAAVIQS